MIYCYSQEQRSFPEYVDFVISEIYIAERMGAKGHFQIDDWETIIHLIGDGYYLDCGKHDIRIPRSVFRAMDEECRIKGIKPRALKKWAKYLLAKHGH